MDEDEQEEGREMSESITKELRSAAVTGGATRIDAWDSVVVMSESRRDDIADRIDERLAHELQSKQAEVDGLKAYNSALRAKLDASILPPVDIDGKAWTCDDVDKPFAPGGVIAIAFDKDPVLREIAYDWPREGWWLVDQYDTHYPADKCRHVTTDPHDSQERIDADAEAGACTYFGHSCVPCYGCPAEDGPKPCHTLQKLDLLRRQRELDGAGEQR